LRFIAGARLLSGIHSPAEAGRAYSAIAASVIRAAHDEVRAAFEAEHGKVPGGRLAILGLGRLGARELTAESDLDLVVLYDYDPENREGDGPRRLDAVVYFTRLTQRLVAALTAPTRRGRLYEVDLRLRPQGGKGPVASHFPGFIAYQAKEAEALGAHGAHPRPSARRRPVLFSMKLARHRRDRLRPPRPGGGRPRRARHARSDRAGEGGRRTLGREARAGRPHGSGVPGPGPDAVARAPPSGLVGLDTAAALAEAGRLRLLSPPDATALGEAHALLTDLLHWQRLTIEGRFDPAAVTPAILKRLAAVAGLPSAAALEERMAELRAQVREIFDRVLGPGERV
jgi:glutamate-ammonia-ligase adenylyltransferase